MLLVLIGGCADSNVRSPLPKLESPPDFAETGTEIAPNRWWTSFGDSNLDLQVENGLRSNYSIQAAAYRVRSARAVARREASDFWPDIDGILGLGTRMGPGENVPNYNFGLDANWQIDLWGEIESRVEAQRLRANATCWDYHAGALAISGEITSVWFALIEAHAQAELLVIQIKTNRTGLELQEKRFGLGFVRSADVLRQRQLLESTLEQAVVVESQINVLEHRFAVLLGQMPQSASYEPGTTFPELPPIPSTGIPSELLLRRPDIQRNYSELAAADRDLASAISAQFPRLNLGGSLQNIAEHPEDLLRDWFASLAGQMIAPLFDGGQRRAEVDRTKAVKLVLFNLYAQSVLEAYRDVEDSLVQEKFQLQRIEHLEEQVKLAGQASNQLREQYLIGDAQYLDVLNAITGQQRLQRNLLNAQLELRLIRVSLYLALAGNIDPNCNVPGFTDSEMLPLDAEALTQTETLAETKAESLAETKAETKAKTTSREAVDLADGLKEQGSKTQGSKTQRSKKRPFIDADGPEFINSNETPTKLETPEPDGSLLDRLRGIDSDE